MVQDKCNIQPRRLDNMIIVKINKEIIGDQLADELNISREFVYADGMGNLIIDADITKTAVDTAIENHSPVVKNGATIQEKLQRAGITLDELREALGL